jgi:hypothetical protein
MKSRRYRHVPMRNILFAVLSMLALVSCRTLQIPDRDSGQDTSEASTDKRDSPHATANYQNQQTTRVKSGKGSGSTAKPIATKKGVFGWVKNAVQAPSSVSGARKIKNSTIINQYGTGNTAASATKPGTMATGTEATATNAKKADAVVVGDGSQSATSAKGPAVAGTGNQVPVTTTEESWLRPLLPYAAGVAGLGLLYSLLPFLPIAGSGWLLVLLKRRKAPPDVA